MTVEDYKSLIHESASVVLVAVLIYQVVMAFIRGLLGD